MKANANLINFNRLLLKHNSRLSGYVIKLEELIKHRNQEIMNLTYNNGVLSNENRELIIQCSHLNDELKAVKDCLNDVGF